MEKFYITTAIAYTSKKPHIGNTYEAILTDAIARYKRMMGYDVHFLTGTDEHGQKIGELAEIAGISPQTYVDDIAQQIRDILDMLGVSYDQFIRTTDQYHKKTVQKIFKKLYDQGDIYKGEYKGMYCVPCESFFTETQLEDGKCPDCGRDVKQTSEEAYFLKLGKYQDKLIEHIENNPDFIAPVSRKNEMMNNFLNNELPDLCVSRTSFKWGIPVEFDKNHVVYVWVDALSNYITALGYDTEKSDAKYDKYWPCDVHIIGKDILRFHTIYWPIMLMALGEPLPKQVFGHPWMLFNGVKMSKSEGNVLYADQLCELFGIDAVRYYCLSQMPYGQDGTITIKNVMGCYNTDLANTIGNLVNRTVAMCNKYFDSDIKDCKVSNPVDDQLRGCCVESLAQYHTKMDSYHIADASSCIMEIANRSNKYIDETAPWILAKDEENHPRLSTVLFNLIEAIRYIAVMVAPFMPTTSEEILKQIGSVKCGFDSLAEFGDNGITKVGTPTVLFARLDEKEMIAKIEAQQQEEVKEDTPLVTTIGIEDFSKVSLIVAEIIECNKVEKSDKLYRLMLDDGTSQRQVVSGIAQFYTSEQLIGKKIILVANLNPVKLRGVMSNGMILAVDDQDDKARVIFVDSDLKNGSKVR